MQLLDIGADLSYSISHVFHPEELNSLHLPNSSISASAKVLAYSAGCCGYAYARVAESVDFEGYTEERELGLISILSSDLTVATYSHTLGHKPMWTASLTDILGDSFGHSLARCFAGGEGEGQREHAAQVVIVDKYDFPSTHWQLTDSLVVVALTVMDAQTPDKRTDSDAHHGTDLCSRFSLQVFAFKGSSGELVWRYNSADPRGATTSSGTHAQVPGTDSPSPSVASSLSLPLDQALSLSLSMPKDSLFTKELQRVLVKTTDHSGLSSSLSPVSLSLADWSHFRASVLSSSLPRFYDEARDFSASVRHYHRQRSGGSVAFDGPVHQPKRQKKSNRAKSSDKDKSRPQVRESSTSSRLSAKGGLTKHSLFAAKTAARNKVPLPLPFQNETNGAGSESVPPLPRNPSSTVKNYRAQGNALVLQSQHGLLALALQTGQPLVSLSLEQGVAYADLDRDGNVDSVRISHNPSHQTERDIERVGEKPDCKVFAFSGLPPQQQLFNTSLHCGLSSGSRTGRAGKGRKARTSSSTGKDDLSRSSSTTTSLSPTVLSAKPLVVSAYEDVISTAEDGTPLLSVKPLTERERHSRITLVTATNTGVVTALSATGRTVWQTHEGAKWSSAFNHRPGVLLLRPYEVSHRVHSVETYTHEDALQESVVLVYGEEELQLFSLATGEKVFTLPLPATLASPPLIQDIDCDHVRDLVLTTTSAYIGYRLHLTPSYYPLILPIFVVLAAAVVAYALKIQVTKVPGVGKIKESRVFKTLRSTDAGHLD